MNQTTDQCKMEAILAKRVGDDFTAEGYWPSEKAYKPSLTFENWCEILRDPALTTPGTMDMLQKMLELGGECSCAQLSKKFGSTYSHYLAIGNGFAKRLVTALHCEGCYDKEDQKVRIFVIPFIGRPVCEDGEVHYAWRMRNELKAALLRYNEEVTEEETH